MSDNLFTAPPVIPAGSYSAAVLSVARTVIETADGPKELVRWEVVLDDMADENGRALVVDALSSMAFGPRSKARRWVTALTGDPNSTTISAFDLVGKRCIAVIAENEKGFTGLSDIVAPLPAKK